MVNHKFTGVGEKMDALDPFYPEKNDEQNLRYGRRGIVVEKAKKR